MLLGFTGDLFLGSLANSETFREVAAALDPLTRLVVNFEGTLYNQKEELQPARRKILLESPVTGLSALDALPIILAATGNNHIGDYGNNTARFTLEQVSRCCPVFGAGLARESFHCALHREGELVLGFVNYCTPDTSPLFCDKARIGPRPLNLHVARRDHNRLQTQAHHCIAIVHWGEEDFHHPRPAHVRLGRRLIDMGFKVVIGHHSHTTQGFERYRDGWIFYSLGNFFFPDHAVVVGGARAEVKWMPRRAWGLMPLFDVSMAGFDLREVKILRCQRNGPPRVVQGGRLARKLETFSSDLKRGDYCQAYRRWVGREKLAIRYEEFLNNPRKIETVLRKFRMLLGAGDPPQIPECNGSRL